MEDNLISNMIIPLCIKIENFISIIFDGMEI